MTSLKLKKQRELGEFNLRSHSWKSLGYGDTVPIIAGTKFFPHEKWVCEKCGHRVNDGIHKFKLTSPEVIGPEGWFFHRNCDEELIYRVMEE